METEEVAYVTPACPLNHALQHLHANACSHLSGQSHLSLNELPRDRWPPWRGRVSLLRNTGNQGLWISLRDPDSHRSRVRPLSMTDGHERHRLVIAFHSLSPAIGSREIGTRTSFSLLAE